MRILGIDYGDARTGVALSDPSGFLASSLPTLKGGNSEKIADQIAALALEHKAGKIILGYPKNMNDTIGERAKKTEALKALLEARCDVPVILWDERQTTAEAALYLRATGKKAKAQKGIIDAVAATIILQSYLDFTRN